MDTITSYLSHEHEDCDTRFADAENAVASRDWARAADFFGAFQAETLKHFAREEDVLFPAFEECTGMRLGPTEVMRDEHAQMRILLQSMAVALASQEGEDYLGHSETLLMLMRQHNMKEEQILYPMAERALAGEQGDLIARMARL